MTVNEMKNLIETNTSYEVEEKEVIKNNETLVGLVVKEAGSSIAPTFYPERMKGMTDEEVIRLVIREVENASEIDNPLENLDKAPVEAKLVSLDNEEYLSDKVYRKYLDMAIVPILKVNVNGNVGSIPVTNTVLDNLDITEEELFNKINIGNGIIRDILGILEEKFGETGIELPPIESPIPMYVVTSESGSNGAIYMTDPETLKKLSPILGETFYILPSSVHEIICIPEDDNTDAENLLSMVTEINNTEVDPQDRLTYSVYRFNGKTVELAATA